MLMEIETLYFPDELFSAIRKRLGLNEPLTSWSWFARNELRAERPRSRAAVPSVDSSDRKHGPRRAKMIELI